MNDNLILILAILISSGIGVYIGATIAKLKAKSDHAELYEKNKTLKNQLENQEKDLIEKQQQLKNELRLLANESGENKAKTCKEERKEH